MLRILLLLAAFGCKSTQPKSGVLGNVDYRLETARPAQVMYHYGEYALLRENGRTKAFSDTVWQQIVGKYESHRQGLFVAVHPAYNERYVKHLAQLKPDGSDGPWLMGVEIKPECLADERFLRMPWRLEADIRLSSKNSSYAGWFAQNCSMTELVSSKTYETYANRFGASTGCSQVLSEFITTNNIGIVQDMYWPHENYWVILNRACIKDIKADPADVLKMMSIREYWVKAPFTTNWDRNQAVDASMRQFRTRLPGAHAFYIMLRAMHELPTWDAVDLQAIRDEGLRSDLMWQVGQQTVAVSELITKTMDKALECQKNNHIDRFKEQTEYYLIKAHTRDDKLAAHEHNYNFVTYGLPKVDCVSAVVAKSAPPAQPKPVSPPAAAEYWYGIRFTNSGSQLSGSLGMLIMLNIELKYRDVDCWETVGDDHMFYCRVSDNVGFNNLKAGLAEHANNRVQSFTQVNKPNPSILK
jgi:hypothetical protein